MKTARFSTRLPSHRFPAEKNRKTPYPRSNSQSKRQKSLTSDSAVPAAASFSPPMNFDLSPFLPIKARRRLSLDVQEHEPLLRCALPSWHGREARRPEMIAPTRPPQRHRATPIDAARSWQPLPESRRVKFLRPRFSRRPRDFPLRAQMPRD